MAFDDTFRPRSYTNEREIFEVLGKPKRFREVRPANFDGPIAEWADYREVVANEVITPIMTFPEVDGDEVHRVAWVHRGERDSATGSVCSLHHHIACDCSMMAELTDEPDSIYECSTLQKTLNRRASLLRGTLMLDKIIRACEYSEESRAKSKSTLDRRYFVAETIMWIMDQDRKHPESWMGNVVSGEHTVSLLSLIVQETPDDTRVLVEELADEGRLDIDEEIVTLPIAA